MRKLFEDFRYLLGRVRLASQRFWAASLVFGLGLISSSFLLWIYSETTHHTSSHLPLITKTNQLRVSISQSHLWLEEYLSGDKSTDSKLAFDALHEALILSDSIQVMILQDPDLCNCPRHAQYLVQMEQVRTILREFVVIAHQRAERPRSAGPGSKIDSVSDSLYRNLLSNTESMRNILLNEIETKRADLAQMLWMVIVIWLGVLVLVFLLTKSKAEHRERVLEALREAEEKVRRFIATADDMIYFQKPDGSLHGLNQAVTKITGYSSREFEQNPQLWWNILHPDDRLTAEKLLSISPRRKATIEIQYRLKTRKGRWRWIQSKKVAVRDADGNFTGYNCIDRDITRQKQNAEVLAAKSLELEKKVREQQCLYKASKVISDESISLDKTFSEIVDLIEMSWQYPDVTQACITFKGKTYTKPGFKPTLWKQSADINLAGEKVGAIEVYYIDEKPKSFEGPFLQEERYLINALAREISGNLERQRAEKEIKRHGRFLGSILDSLTYPFYVLDARDYTIRMANTTSGADLSTGSLKCYQLTHQRESPCSSESHPCPVDTVRRTGSHCVVEHIHFDRNGDRRYHEVHGYPLTDESGEVVQVIEYMFDITERKLTEHKLGELAAFPANNPNVVMSLNSSGEVLYMNAATAERLRNIGISPKDADQCLPPQVKKIIARCLESEKGVQNIVNEVHGRTWTWSFHPVAGRNLIHCYATDITELIRHEKEVRKLSAAVNQSSTMICITDTSGIVEYVNPYFTQVTGYLLPVIVGQPIGILKSGEHDQEFYAEMWGTITAGKSWTGNVKNRKRSGDLYWERKTITPIHNDEGEIVSFLSVSNDITHELKTQQKLIEADKLSAIGTLAGGVAHEFKNYLGGIIGNASFALDQLDRKDGLATAAETLHKIIEMGERANDVTMSLLTYSRARPDEMQPENLRVLIEKSVRLVEKELHNQSIELVTHFEDTPPVEISASKLQQLLLNLLINARQAIRSHGVITVALFAADDYVEIRVGDTGTGIPKDNLERIFDPFFSTKGVWGKDEVTGTGIGLSICRNIANEFGGELSVESIVGIGTTFTLTLPLSRSDASHLPPARQPGDALQILIFTLETSIIKKYYPDACRLNTRLLAVDNIVNVPHDLSSVADIVICDSQFTGKLELLRMVDACREQKVPFVMVNCGASEYELGDIHKHSRANFKDLPGFTRIYSLFRADVPDTTDTPA
ncbi:MAG: PAS domain S-box protein [Candidatus Zixiibacteriota bacterium]|nr:MAG: PAS domain S-box protein [candidate division Zixibacteria bacterium]